MRRSVAVLLTAAAALGGGGAAGAAASRSGAAGARTTTPAAAARRAAQLSQMLVYAQEWSLWPSRTSVPAGAVAVTLWNRGQDPHDLAIRRVGHGRPVGEVAAVASGSRSAVTWRLARGRYELYCALPGHRKRGMHTLITVS